MPRSTEPTWGSPPPSASSVIRRITLHGQTAEVMGPRVLRRTANLQLSAYPDASPRGAADFAVVAKRSNQRRTYWTIAYGDRRRSAGPGVSQAALFTEWALVSEFLQRWTQFIHVHAGLIATPEQSTLLIGRSGSGKSTTTMALALEGFELYSDDVALVHRDSMQAFCVPRPIKLDPIARRMLRARGLSIPPRTWLGESIDRTVLPGLPNVGAPGPPVRTALFFADTRQPRPALRRLSSAEAVMRLILQSVSEQFGDSGPSASAINLVNSVDCFELTAGNLSDTVDLLIGFLRGGDERLASSSIRQYYKR
jgi:hypothetical protein